MLRTPEGDGEEAGVEADGYVQKGVVSVGHGGEGEREEAASDEGVGMWEFHETDTVA